LLSYSTSANKISLACEFSATSSYFKGIVETAFAVAIDDAIKAMDIPPHMAWGIEDD